MKKFDGILLCTDLDGTLLREDKSVSKENLEAITYFQREGGLFTFVTGRMPFCVEDILQQVQPNCPFGCINGGGIFDHRKGCYEWNVTMPGEALDMVEHAEKALPEIGFQVNTFDKIYFCKENTAMEDFRAITGMPNITCHYRDIKEPLAKVVFGDRNEANINRLQELLAAHPLAGQFDFIRSEKRLYEILPKGISKGTVLLKLAEILYIDRSKTIAVGDYNNDIAMLQAAGAGFAVANARPEVKKAADYITVSNEEHAIARIIRDLEAGSFTL